MLKTKPALYNIEFCKVPHLSEIWAQIIWVCMGDTYAHIQFSRTLKNSWIYKGEPLADKDSKETAKISKP